MAIQKKLPELQKVTTLPAKKKDTTVADLRKRYRFLPLHFIFGIEKEIEHQCPSIDHYLDQLEEAKTALQKIRRCKNLDKAKIHAATALHALDSLPEDLDITTRSNFEKLRQTAKDWKQLAIKAINATRTPDKFVNM